MKTLQIVWQRLVDPVGATCVRCGATERELQKAVGILTEAFRPLGFEPKLETRTMNEQSFRANPSGSNAIWIAGQPLEKWLGATTGTSRCCSVCGDSECRTVETGEEIFETVPAALIVKAALIAVAHSLAPTASACSV